MTCIYGLRLGCRIVSMRCFACSASTHVLDSRPSDGAVRRRRECLVCRERFTTWERVEADDLERTVLAYVRNLNTTKEMTPHG